MKYLSIGQPTSWQGRTSDKFLTENFGFLIRNLLPGDLVLADRGFTIHDKVMFYHENLNIPALTKGKSQLDPVKIEKTLNLANYVRIHVERVIGVLRQKYSILQSKDYHMCNTSKDGNEDVPLVNRMIRVCVPLVNLCPPIIPLD